MPDQKNAEVITMAGVKERMAMFSKNSSKVSAPRSKIRKAPSDKNEKTINVAARRAMLDEYSKQKQTSGSNSSMKMERSASFRKKKGSAAPTKETTTVTKETKEKEQSHDEVLESLNSSMNDLNKSATDLNASFDKPDIYFEGDSSDEEELNDTKKKKSQEVKDKEEEETRDNLNTLLQKELGDNKKSISWGGARVRYIKAVDKLRPDEYDLPIELDEDKPAAKQHLKKQRQVAAETKGRFTALSNAWVKYDDAAQDKPFSASDEDWAIQNDLDDIEDQVADEWQDFCERVEDTKATFFDDSDDSDSSDEDSDMEMWRQEARKLKADSSALKKRREKRDEKRQEVLEWQGFSLDSKSGRLETKKSNLPSKNDEKEEESKPPRYSGRRNSVSGVPEKKDKAKVSGDNVGRRNSVLGVPEVKAEKKDKAKESGSSVMDALAKAQAEAEAIMNKTLNKYEDPTPSSPPAAESDDNDDEDDESEEESEEEQEPERPELDDEAVPSEDNEDDDSDDSNETPPPSPKHSKPSPSSKENNKTASPETAKPQTKKKVVSKKKKPTGKDSSSTTTRSSPPTKAKPVKRKGDDPWKKTASVSGFKAWTNAPKEYKEVGTKVTVTVPRKTDYWRKTRHNFIMDNAPFYWHKVTGDFEVLVHVSGNFNSIYDKAGILIRHDAENWIVSALEYFNNGMNHSTSVTHDFTDWSLCPLPKETLKEGAWICCKRIGNSYETFYSLNGSKWVQTRQGMFGEADSARVGIFCACPMGTGFNVEFDLYTCKNIKEGMTMGTFNFH